MKGTRARELNGTKMIRTKIYVARVLVGRKRRQFAISASSYEEAGKYEPAEDGGPVLRYPKEAAVEELGGHLNTDNVR
jgi:hypothetical protein